MYAANTKVPVEKSQMEIKKILSKYGAYSFAFAETKDSAMIMFELRGKRIVFKLPLITRSTNASQKVIKDVEQKNRSKWRSLVLGIKAKLECVESGITTLEQEFLAHIMLPNGSTFGEVAIPQIDRVYETQEMPNLMALSYSNK